jgi:hypothetical protein
MGIFVRPDLISCVRKKLKILQMCQEKTKDITNVSVMTKHLLQKVKCKLL